MKLAKLFKAKKLNFRVLQTFYFEFVSCDVMKLLIQD